MGDIEIVPAGWWTRRNFQAHCLSDKLFDVMLDYMRTTEPSDEVLAAANSKSRLNIQSELRVSDH